MISVNVTLIIQMINFLVLLFFMNMILYRPIRRLIAQRNRFVVEQQEEIEQANLEADEALRTFKEHIQEARRLGREKLQQMKDKAYEEQKAMIAQANQTAASELQAVKERIAREIKGVRDQLRDQIDVFSRELAAVILGRSL